MPQHLSDPAPATTKLDGDALSQVDASIQADIDQGQNFATSIIVAHKGVMQHRRMFGMFAPGRAAAPQKQKFTRIRHPAHRLRWNDRQGPGCVKTFQGAETVENWPQNCVPTSTSSRLTPSCSFRFCIGTRI